MATTDQAPKTTLAEQLKRLRQAKGHPTARGFAKTLGISENRYSRYERGEAVPKLDLVWAICSELGITPNELYGWDASAHPRDVLPRPNGAVRTPGKTVHPTAPGLADEPAQFTHQSSATKPASSTVAAVTWRLATALTEASRPAGDSKLLAIRATAEMYSRLKADPFQAIATCLQSLDLGPPGKADIESRLATEIESFLATLGAGEGSDPRS